MRLLCTAVWRWRWEGYSGRYTTTALSRARTSVTGKDAPPPTPQLNGAINPAFPGVGIFLISSSEFLFDLLFLSNLGKGARLPSRRPLFLFLLCEILRASYNMGGGSELLGKGGKCIMGRGDGDYAFAMFLVFFFISLRCCCCCCSALRLKTPLYPICPTLRLRLFCRCRCCRCRCCCCCCSARFSIVRACLVLIGTVHCFRESVLQEGEVATVV
ncbi:hypothetical protein BS50DRAFT_381647 [Corynespora cassiicola Philippines]|uniref:Uncharacterized protein n=1 Tax=Corynespora cassiicola Philippines TaxID=1448308 RepID=A0A2T2NPA6_CORCC|nr:hypothetical protein BS50DRAFT_381647 [Corynespora cassiicola Philippines]